jgi:hypothetical protein
LSLESNMIPSHLMCGDGGIMVVFVSCGLGILIDGSTFVSCFRLVK